MFGTWPCWKARACARACRGLPVRRVNVWLPARSGSTVKSPGAVVRIALLLPWRLHELKRQWMKCTADIKRPFRLRDEVRDDPSCAGRKGAHVMSDFRELDPLRVAADDLCDASAFVWFGNRINCASQDQRRHSRGGWYEQRGAKGSPGIADPGKPGKDVVRCGRFCATKMRPVSAFHRGGSGNLARQCSLI